ncbi:MAG: Gfo/Idh/MocA family oxidoreductase [Patescibacteria group bacterium]
MKILLVGFGSIGKRHYRNLTSLGYRDIAVFDPSDKAFENADKIIRIKKFDIDSAKDFNTAFICSPNNLHIKHALICANAGLHLFIEKPLSHNFNGFNLLKKICRKKKLVTMIGCNMRFHPCLEFIKKYIDGKKLGKIYSIRHELGYYLPYWRPAQDYRKNYAAKKSTGGGIILDDVHEYDLLFWLNNFDKVIKSRIIFNRASDLKIETEDQAAAIFLFENKVLGTIISDYLQQYYARKCKVVGEKGALEWDFKENTVLLKIKDNIKKLFELKDFDFNQTYIKEVKYFFGCIKDKKRTSNTVEIAGDILKYCVKK